MIQKKLIVTFYIIMMIIISGMGVVFAQETGDLNQDGVINSLDMVIMNKHLVDTSYAIPGGMSVGDLNGDAQVNSIDKVLLQRYILNIIDIFPINESQEENLIIQEKEPGFLEVIGPIEDEHAGYTGTGYANTDNEAGNYIEWALKVPDKGRYRLQWRYACESSLNRTGEIIVNGITQFGAIGFPATGSWTSWDITDVYTVELKEGNNIIRLSAETEEGLANIDWIKITGKNPQAGSSANGGSDNDDIEPPVANVDFSMIGFATMAGGTTGGRGGREITVSTGAEILDAISAKKNGDINEPLTIYVDGRITTSNTGASKIDIKDVNDISIIGVGENALFDGIGIKIWRASNVIIRNLTIRYVDTGDKDCIGIEGPADHIWIDHNEIYNEYDGADKDYYDGLIDAKNDAEYITISWNYLHDSWKTSLVGRSDSDLHDRKITYHHNYFENCNSRLPSFRGGQGHLFNNYYNNIHSTTINSRMGAELLIDNNYFENTKDPIGSWYSDDEGYWNVSNNIFINCSGSTPEHSTTYYTPPYDYKGFLYPAEEVKSLVTKYCGVGVIDINQNNLGNGGYDPGYNIPPEINLISPAGGESFRKGDILYASAQVLNNEGYVQRVEWYVNEHLYTVQTSPPWNVGIDLNFFEGGFNNIYAVAENDRALTAQSDIVYFEIKEDHNGDDDDQQELGFIQSELKTDSNFKAADHYVLENVNSGMVLDVEKHTIDKGANIVQRPMGNSTYQLWKIDDSKSPYYIINKYSDKVLHVESRSKDDGANIVQEKDGSSSAHTWHFERIEGGYFRIVNENSSKVLGVEYGSTADGANIIQTTYTGDNSQHWKVAKVEASKKEEPDFSLQGFAAVEAYGQKGTTGGIGGEKIIVDNYQDLVNHMALDDPYIIYVKGSIYLPENTGDYHGSSSNNQWYVGSNTSIIGLGSDAEIVGGGFHIYSGDGSQRNAQEEGRNNIVIRNLTFRDGPEDAVTVEGGSHHVWIDHCVFNNYDDGLIDIKRGSDFVTLSWNYFYDHHKTILIGHDDSVGHIDDGFLHVTMHHNYFEDTYGRHPRLRYGKIHSYNNYFHEIGDYVYGIGVDGQIVSENNHIEKANRSTKWYDSSSQRGYVKDINSIFTELAHDFEEGLRPEGIDWDPKDIYSYTLNNTLNVREMLKKYTGVGIIETP